MKPVVLITKVGAVFWTRELSAQNSSVGEQGETEGVINHLLERDDIQLVYFGQWRGALPEGLIYIPSYLDNLDELTSARLQEHNWAIDTKNVSEMNPKFFVNIAGYASTMGWVGNPHGSGVQACAIRYVSPHLNILQSCKLARIVINNDPRSYPRCGEIGLGWDWTRPRALLSQRTLNWSRTIQGSKFDVREVYAGAENWCEHIPQAPINDLPVMIVAHAHIKDGCKFAKREGAWATVLSPPKDNAELLSMGMRVYGRGWQHFSGYNSELMPGCIRPDEVMNVLARAKVCPAVSAGDGFYTGKLRTCLAQDCLPIFFGSGEPFTFDPLEKYVPFDSDIRIKKPGDLLRLVKYFDTHEDIRKTCVSELLELSKPDWTLFDKCINDALDGRDMETESWHQEFGGYRASS